MSGSRDGGGPPEGRRFAKGTSGNATGRPRKTATPPPLRVSAFDIVIDRTLSVVQGGVAQDLTLEAALQLKTYQQALAGSRLARKAILTMIGKREAARAKQDRPIGAQLQPVKRRAMRGDPANADAAMLLLGIATRDVALEAAWGDRPGHRVPLLLEPWAVQAALGRRRAGGPIEAKVLAAIQRCTRDPDRLRWPRGSRG